MCPNFQLSDVFLSSLFIHWALQWTKRCVKCWSCKHWINHCPEWQDPPPTPRLRTSAISQRIGVRYQNSDTSDTPSQLSIAIKIYRHTYTHVLINMAHSFQLTLTKIQSPWKWTVKIYIRIKYKTSIKDYSWNPITLWILSSWIPRKR